MRCFCFYLNLFINFISFLTIQCNPLELKSIIMIIIEFNMI